MATHSRRHFRRGDVVVVRNPDEILSTLDANGTADSLPFMPEMAAFCGQRFRVARRLEKTCVEGDIARRFPGNDVVFLEELRCSGTHHDGCKRACMIFWKEGWLRPSDPDQLPAVVSEEEREQLRKHLRVKTDSTHYFCQSTQLSAATERFPWKLKPWMVWVALREAWVGNRSAGEALRLLVHGIKLLNRQRKGEEVLLLRGPNKRTPTESLGLEPGEWVRIRSKDEITETLDGDSRNRGLSMSQAMTLNCGRRYQVLDRFDRMIDETTGKMRDVQNTVSLRGLECLCYYQFGGCPRGDLQYLREIWLERCPHPSGDLSSTGPDQA